MLMKFEIHCLSWILPTSLIKENTVRIFVTGAAGMLGTAMKKILDKDPGMSACHSDLNPGEDVELLDVLDYDEAKRQITDFAPDMVFHFAAETDVDLCEKDIDHAFRTNSLGTENIVNICMRNSIKLVYIGTGAVFDGKKKEPYTEFDTPNPSNCYAKAKYEGEVLVRRFLRDYLIVRAGWMIGGGKKDKKFVAKIIEIMENRDSVQIVNDKTGSPTFTFDFAAGILKLVEMGKFGLYHMVNQGVTTRLEIAREIKKLKNYDCEIVPVSSAYFPLPAPRSDSEALENYKLNLLGLQFMPHWKDSLKKYLQELD